VKHSLAQAQQLLQALATGLILSISANSFAQDDSPTEQNSENNPASSVELNEPRYVSDLLYVPLRSGDSSKHRVVHKGLKSGTFLTLLEKKDNGWARVRTSRGTEGWIQSRYLLSEPTAKIQLQQAQEQIQNLSSKAGPISQKLLDSEKNVRSLKSQIQQLERDKNTQAKELERIKKLAGDQVRLDNDNKSLLQKNETLRNSLDTVKAENTRLSEQLRSDDFMYGAFAVILGIIATMIIQHLTRSRKRSDWG